MEDLYHGRVMELAADIPHVGRLEHADGAATKVSRVCGSVVTVSVRVTVAWCRADGSIEPYDFTDIENMHEMMLPFLEHFVLKARYADEPERFKAASPVSYAHSEAPPFFVLHGEKDELVPAGQSRAFCAARRSRHRHHPDCDPR